MYYKLDVLANKGYVVLRDRRGADYAGRMGVPRISTPAMRPRRFASCTVTTTNA
jgi:hypothetical protein